MGSPWRVHAQRITTGEWLSHELPLQNSTTVRELSGPGAVSGIVSASTLAAKGDDGRPLLEEWTTALYVEENDRLRGGGILETIEYDGPVMTVNAPGFAAYATGIPIMDPYLPVDGFEDPTDVFRNLWKYVQSFPDGDLGLDVLGDHTYMVLGDGEGPYTVSPYEVRDAGDELTSIAESAPFDYVENHAWTAGTNHTQVDHWLRIGFPRLGRRRTDLRFADGENIVRHAAITPNGATFSNDVYGEGPGEGRRMLRSRATVRDGRLRRPLVLPMKRSTQGRLDRATRRALAANSLKIDVAEVTISDHPNARIGAVTVGDDILVQVEVQWLGDIRLWVRVLAVEESGDRPGEAVLKTQRSDAFQYANPTAPTNDPVLVIV